MAVPTASRCVERRSAARVLPQPAGPPPSGGTATLDSSGAHTCSLCLPAQEWGPTLAICCVMVTVCLAGVLAIHLSLSPGGLSWRPVPHRTSRRHATQDGGGSDKASALIAGGPTDAPTGSSQGADTPGPAVRDGSEAGAAPAEPPRTSAQAEPLSDAQLHGGWQLTQEASSARGGRVGRYQALPVAS